MFAGADGDREAAHPGGARTLAGRRGHPGHRRPRSRRSCASSHLGRSAQASFL